MDWDKAKNLTIVFLSILDLCLALLLYINSTEYVLAQEQEDAIIKVLAQNNITLHAQMPRKYKPMAQIQLETADYDIDRLINVFLGEGSNITQTTEYDKIIYVNSEQNKTLTFAGDAVIFENEAGSGAADFTRTKAKEACDRVIGQDLRFLSNLVFDNPENISTKDGFRLEYRQIYKNYVIYANYAAFTLTENGIVKIEFSYKKPIGFENKTREIISSDEALYALMQHILNMYKDRKIDISKMDMVYSQEESGEENAASLKTIPCYRFWVEGMETPYLVNAYTGVVE